MLKLFRLIKPYRGYVAIILVLALAQSIGVLLLPRLMSDIVDRGIVKGDQRAILGVLTQEAVQMSRARSRQTDDEHRVADRLSLDERIRRALRLEAQQVLEQAHEQLADGDPAERREVGFAPIGVEQTRERLFDRPRAECARARTPLRGTPQVLELERRRIGAEPVQRPAARV